MSDEERCVLVVDDDEDIRSALLMVLEMHGFCALAERNGTDALARLASAPKPALVLVDLRMPRMSGKELIAAMHSDRTLRAIPVVVLSGDEAAQETADTMRVQGCLRKPVELSELVNLVHRFVDAPEA